MYPKMIKQVVSHPESGSCERSRDLSHDHVTCHVSVWRDKGVNVFLYGGRR